MQPTFVQRDYGMQKDGVVIYGPAFGTAQGHVHTERGIADGSHIPAGSFVAYSPLYMTATCQAETRFILPDLEGTTLMRNSLNSGDFSGIISDALVDGEFQIVGIAKYAGTGDCKKPCRIANCCPTGFPIGHPQHLNYWDQGSEMGVITQGPVVANNITDIKIGDELHIVVGIDPEAPCANLGAVTTEETAFTQPLNIDYRITGPAMAGSGVILELGRK